MPTLKRMTLVHAPVFYSLKYPFRPYTSPKLSHYCAIVLGVQQAY